MPTPIRVPSKLYPPANRCIYCGDDTCDLSLEHIIPLSLGGRLRIPKSSCEVCRLKIHPIETFCAEKMLVRFRRRLNFPSRNKRRWPAGFDVRVYGADGRIGSKNIAIRDYPRMLSMPVYPPAALTHGPSDEDIQLWTMASPSDLQKSKSIIGGEHFEAGPYDVVYFARMLAKIAHGIFEAEYRDEFPGFSPILNDFILHSTGDMLDFVGCDRNWPDADVGLMYRAHSGVYTMQDDSQYLALNIRLFAHWRTPVYEIIVAKRP